MRLPFLKLEQDAYVRARTMARLLKIPVYAGIGLAAELFAWGLDMAPQHNGEVDLSGDLDDDEPAELVAAGIGWEGDPDELFQAMIKVGFIAHPTERPARIRGLDRYADTLTTPEQRSEQARKAANARWAASRPDAQPMLNDAQASMSIAPELLIDAQTQTQTQTQTLKEEAPASRSRPGKVKKPPDPRLEPLTDALAEIYRAQRHEPYRHAGAKDADGLKSLLPLANDAEIRSRWGRALSLGTAWPGCSTFAQLASKWNDLAAPAGPKRAREQFDPNGGIMTHSCDDPDCSQCNPRGYQLEPSPEAA